MGSKDIKDNVKIEDPVVQPEPEGGIFECSICALKEKYHYKGTSPPFAKLVNLKVESYVMKDPFNPPGKMEVFVLGADCSSCKNSVCIDKDCAVFYNEMFCIHCAKKDLMRFPEALRKKLTK